jgi:SPP1 family predicted phage head-tail adaptor
VTITAPDWVTASDGGLIQSPPTAATLATRWAKIRTISGSERFRLQQLTPEAEHVVELREYLATVTEKMRVVYGSRTFEIERAVHDEMTHAWTTLYCRETK